MKMSRLCFVALLLGLWPGTASAGDSCAKFMERLAEVPPNLKGHYPVPKFERTMSEGGTEIRAVLTFDDVRAGLLCEHGDFGKFSVTAQNPDVDPGNAIGEFPVLLGSPASDHVLVLTKVSVHAATGNWQVADDLTNSLYLGLRADPYHIDKYQSLFWSFRASLVISSGRFLDFLLEAWAP
jgi:hypothetical protein